MAEIAIRNVSKSYGKTAVVHAIDLGMANGSFTVILGPSGCGKSTLLRMIAGLEGITGGEIAIGGKVVNALEPRERGCAMVFQNYALYPHMSVADNIGYALKVAGTPRDERRRRIEDIAAKLELTPYLDRRPAQLSGGQRQRVAMGRAMIREPQVFLFDEPLSNLDAKLRVQMRIEIRKLHERLSATSVFVTHDQIEAMTLADNLIVMNQGRVEQVGRPTEVYAKPATVFVASFIGSPPMNLLPGTIVSAHEVEVSGTRIIVEPIAGAMQIGRSVMLGIRPEDVAVKSMSGTAPTMLSIEIIEELGAMRLCHGTLAGQSFIAQVPLDAKVMRGHAVPVMLDPAVLHLFDSASGQRITANAAPSLLQVSARAHAA
jgi:sn-glycerol 3-phosphate transport system ATP-binding protein